MKQNLYIFSDTNLKRKDNTLLCETICRNGEEYDEELDSREEYYIGEDIMLKLERYFSNS